MLLKIRVLKVLYILIKLFLKIAPEGTGIDFWLAFQFANGRAAGIVDKISLDFESGALSFPVDCADSEAAFSYENMDSCALKV